MMFSFSPPTAGGCATRGPALHGDIQLLADTKLLFEHLDSLLIRCECPPGMCVMLLAAHRCKILRPIVGLESVEVVNDPTFWQWSPVRLLPDDMVLAPISPCSRSVRAGLDANKDIAFAIHNPPLLPVWTALATISDAPPDVVACPAPLGVAPNGPGAIHTTRLGRHLVFGVIFASISLRIGAPTGWTPQSIRE